MDTVPPPGVDLRGLPGRARRGEEVGAVSGADEKGRGVRRVTTYMDESPDDLAPPHPTVVPLHGCVYCNRRIGQGSWHYKRMPSESVWAQQTGTVHRWSWECDECGQGDNVSGLCMDPCEHPSATAVDQAPFGPTKVFRCDACGAHWRLELDPEDFGQSTFVVVPVDPPISARPVAPPASLD